MTILAAGLSVCAIPSYAQQWQTSDAASVRECFQRNDRQYASMVNMKLTTLLSSYRNAGDALPNDKGSSIVWRTGDSYKAEHLGMTTYQDKQLSVLIDPAERTIMVSAPTDMMASMRGAMQDSMFAHVAKIGRASLGDGTHFRLKFTPGALYDVMELVFDPQGWLRREDVYWGQPVTLNPDDPASGVAYPKVVFAFGVPEQIDPSTVDADPASVVAWKDGEPVALGSWKDYAVFDTRPK